MQTVRVSTCDVGIQCDLINADLPIQLPPMESLGQHEDCSSDSDSFEMTDESEMESAGSSYMYDSEASVERLSYLCC